MSNANEPDQVNTGALATTIGIVACATLGIALFVTSLVREETKVLGDARQGTQERGVRGLQADSLSALASAPTWKDKAAGVVTLPIGRAMDWMIEAVRKDPKALSPWHPPKPEALGGAGPEATAEEPAGTGGANGAAAGDEGKTAEKATPKKVLAPAPAAAPSAPAAAPSSPPAPTSAAPSAP